MLHLSRLRDAHPVEPFDRALGLPLPGSTEELESFAALQKRLVRQFSDVFPNPRAERTVVVVPSLSVNTTILAKISGVAFYEERMLFMLMLLRLPNTRVIYLTSQPIASSIIDYYLNLLPGIPMNHARSRLVLLSCYDQTPIPLSQKILDRPRLIRRIREAIGHSETAHMTVFNSTALERTLAIRLDTPLYACDPSICSAGTKSGSREVFAEAGLTPPPGFGGLGSSDEMAEALAELHGLHPEMRRAVVKLNEGVSGEGNAIFSFDGAPDPPNTVAWIRRELPDRLRYEAVGESWDSFSGQFGRMGGVVEGYIDGYDKRSPSVQARIDPVCNITVVSTHDQILGGPSRQVFLGCSFPADPTYRLDIQRQGLRVAEVLKRRGVLGRFGIDFVSVRGETGWVHHPIEVNLRKGGTTHPFMMLQYLTDGYYDTDSGQYYTPSGLTRCYYASDNLSSPLYRGFTPEDLTDISVNHGLHFHAATQEGVVFHLIGALSEHGKLGLLCISDTIENARRLYMGTVDVLDREAGAQEEARARFRGDPVD